MSKKLISHVQVLRLAEPIDEPDRGEIKWKKIKWVRKRGKNYFEPKRGKHPGTVIARLVLKEYNISLRVCGVCGRVGKMQVHHINGNPYDNSLCNLKVICCNCHRKAHKFNNDFDVLPDDFGVTYE